MQRDLIHHRSINQGVVPVSAPPINYDGHARTVNIAGGSFTNFEGNYNHSVTVNHHGTGILTLYNHIAENALHDASERYPAPNCHPGTREDALGVIKTWIKNDNAETGLLWLSGKVGVGKSAVMQDLTEKLLGADPEQHPIAASFFFGRGKEKRSLGKYLFPTIAYQLAQNICELCEPIDRVMQADPALPTRSIKTQFQSLIINPLLQCRAQEVFITPRVIMIDGLDECEDPDGETQQLIINCIAAVQHIHDLPLHFVIASRPEHQICEALDKHPVASGLHRVHLDNFKSSKDIEKFLRAKFSDIYHRKSHLMPHVSSSWPGDFVIFWLIEKAMGQWIYIATVIKFTDTKFTSPDKQLNIVRDCERQSLALFPLDNLYTQILSGHPEPKVLLTVLGYLVLCDSDTGIMSASVGLDSGDIEITLQVIQSLLNDDSLSLAHASFQDYLCDSKRSGNFFIDEDIYRTKYAVLAFVATSSSIIDDFQQSAQHGQIVTNLNITQIHQHNLYYPEHDGGEYNLSQIQIDTLTAVALDFKTTIASIELSPIPFALNDLTEQLLSSLYAIYNFLRRCKLEFSEISYPYRLLLYRCLDVLCLLPGSLHALICFAPAIITISRGVDRLSTTALSQLLKVERQPLEELLRRNYIFFAMDYNHKHTEGFSEMERSVCHYSVSVILDRYCCLSSARLSFLDDICSTALQPHWFPINLERLAQIQFDDPKWGLEGAILFSNPFDEPERMKECSDWPSHSHNFFESLKVYTQNFHPNLANAHVPVIRCILNVLDFIVRILSLAEGIHPQESTALKHIQDQIFCQVFQLTSHQNRNMIIFQQPFLAYHALTVNSHDISQYSGHLTTLPNPPPSVDHDHQPQLSPYLLGTDRYHAEWFMGQFFNFASDSLRSGAMFVGPYANIIQQIKQIKASTCGSDPNLQAIIKRNCGVVLQVLDIEDQSARKSRQQ